MLRRSLVVVLALALGCATRQLPPAASYCVGCNGVNRVTFAFTPAPPHPELASLEITFTRCPDGPVTLPLGFDGFVVKTTVRPETPAADTGFEAGELTLQQCSMERVTGTLWLTRPDGSRIEHAVDLPVRVTTED